MTFNLVQSIGSDPLSSCDIAKLPENRAKNRYANIFACKYLPVLYVQVKCMHEHIDDFSRVKLQQREEDESDYINSCYIDV